MQRRTAATEGQGRGSSRSMAMAASERTRTCSAGLSGLRTTRMVLGARVLEPKP